MSPGHPDRLLTGVAAYGVSNASVRARLVQWTDRLGPRSAELVLAGSDPLGLAAHRRALAGGDVPVVVLRNAAKLTRGGLESRLLRSGRPGVYDLDDGLPWDDGRLPGLGAWWKRPWPRSLIARRAATAADRVIAGNEVLAEWAASRCADVRVIPTCVEPAEYVQKTTWEVSHPPRIGWLGSPATEGYLQDLAPALAQVHRRTGARLTIVSGPGVTSRELAPFSDRVEWSPDVQRTLPCTWDVGIMPLRDGVYERAKCAYKLLQYGAVGLPMVGSPVGTNEAVLRGFGAPAPANTSDWVDALCTVIEAPASQRERSARVATRVVAESFSYDAWESRWRAAVGLDLTGPPRSAGPGG